MNFGIEQFLHKNVSVISYDKNGLVALEKGCGILSHPNNKNDIASSLFACSYDFKKQAYFCEVGDVYLLNRLDSPVSGVILAGLNEEVADSAKAVFRQNDVSKQYVALVKGFPRVCCGVWRSRLKKSFVGSSMKMMTGSGLFAETRFEVVESFRFNGVTLSILQLFPVTGRTHQLRIQCAENGLPILGDATYGDRKYNEVFAKISGSNRLFLHSKSVSFDYVFRGEKFSFAAESRYDFEKDLASFKKN